MADDEDLLRSLEESFECPITQEVMVDPVTLVETGYTYERSAIRKAFKRPKIDPLTNGPLKSQRVVPNRALKSAIETFTHATHHVLLPARCPTCGASMVASVAENDGICQTCQELLLDETLVESGTCVICSTPTHGAEMCSSCEQAAEKMLEEDDKSSALPVYCGNALTTPDDCKATRTPFTSRSWTPSRRRRDAATTPSTAASRSRQSIQW